MPIKMDRDWYEYAVGYYCKSLPLEIKKMIFSNTFSTIQYFKDMNGWDVYNEIGRHEIWIDSHLYFEHISYEFENGIALILKETYLYDDDESLPEIYRIWNWVELPLIYGPLTMFDYHINKKLAIIFIE